MSEAVPQAASSALPVDTCAFDEWHGFMNGAAQTGRPAANAVLARVASAARQEVTRAFAAGDIRMQPLRGTPASRPAVRYRGSCARPAP